jgi:hypothetical protein
MDDRRLSHHDIVTRALSWRGASISSIAIIPGERESTSLCSFSSFRRKPESSILALSPFLKQGFHSPFGGVEALLRPSKHEHLGFPLARE